MPVPASTRGSRARKRPRARRSAGTQASVVTSPDPMSSSSARRTISFILAQLSLVLGEFGADRVPDLRGGLGEKRLVGKLALGVFDVLPELIDLLLDPLFLRVLLALGNLEDEVELRRRTNGRRFRRGPPP